jgi:hypothetical protein
MRSPCVAAVETFMLEPLDGDPVARSARAVADPVRG